MKKSGRNDPCPCGSGKKYKQCCQRIAEPQPASVPIEEASLSHAIHTAIVHHQAGRFADAEAIYRQVLQVAPDHADALHLLGLIAYQTGNSNLAIELITKAIAANPSSAMYCNIGNALQALGRFDEAIRSFRTATQLKSDNVEAHNNLGNALQAKGQLNEAAASFRHALSIKPDYADAYINLGNVLQTQSDLDGAIACFRHALSLRPGHAFTYYNLGNALKEQGKLDAAIEIYLQALSLQANHADLHLNLGNAFHEQGESEKAAECFHRALAIDANCTGAYNGLAAVNLSQGNVQSALELAILSLRIKETRETKTLIVSCVKDVSFEHADPGISKLLSCAISEPWGRPGDLATAAISLVLSDPDIKQCVERATSAWPVRLKAEELFSTSCLSSIANHSLLQCLLENAPACNLQLEQFLTLARATLLDAAIDAAISPTPDDKVVRFYSALARQCFINEYVYSCEVDEFNQASVLREKLETALGTKAQVPALWVVAVASYFPLNALHTAENLVRADWPEAVQALIAQQVTEPMEELRYRADMPHLTPIIDDVSRLVQQQYEENPYPRWVKCAPPGKIITIDAFIRRQFPKAPFRPLSKGHEIDILIAGCGTGQQSIEAAQQFRHANVLAIDLSLASLSYAKRKTRELGVTNIEYAQADIMKLGDIDRTFDIIESVGVLHHLGAPWVGWRVLLSLLRSGGFMRLGFYSERAREIVVAARDFIARQGYASTAIDIRRARQDLLGMENSKLGDLCMIKDFFGTSECRDLLFHVQEHRFTLPQIKDAVREFNLDFIGFSLEPGIARKYEERFPDDKAKTNLDYWHIFESENPRTFAGMYQFIVQKRL